MAKSIKGVIFCRMTRRTNHAGEERRAATVSGGVREVEFERISALPAVGPGGCAFVFAAMRSRYYGTGQRQSRSKVLGVPS